MKTDKTFFRHTFICPECENYNYRVTDRPNPYDNYTFIDCGSCLKRIPMTTHHATDVCLPPVFDTDLICASIICAGMLSSNHYEPDRTELASVALLLTIKKYLKEESENEN